LIDFSFDEKSITQEKGRIKERNRAEGKGLEGVFWRKWYYVGLDFIN